MNKKIKILIVCILISFILIFLIQFTYKKIRNGNNIGKSNVDLIEYILNISSYEANIELTVVSNKTINKYELKQYYKEPQFFKQVVNSPENIKNLEMLYNGKELTIKNSKLETVKIYQNFKYINENKLWLISFIESCKENSYSIDENDTDIIMKNKQNEILYVNKEKKLPIKLEVNDNNNNAKVYIEYKEIKINSISDNNIFAFTTKDIKADV